MKNVIILMRMYAGSYIQNNIGHEVINLFKDDNGNNYIYINEDGKINTRYNNSVLAVLLVRYVEKGVMEVIAKAEQLEQIMFRTGDIQEETAAQIRYVENNQVKYGGVLLHKIWEKSEQEKIVLTFKANKVRYVKQTIYLIEDESKISSYRNFVLLPEKHFSSQSLKMYYHSADLPDDFGLIESIINDDSLWEEKDTTTKIDPNDNYDGHQHNGFLSIIKKEYDELVYSNMLAYFFEQNKVVFIEFAKEILNIDSLSKQFEIKREHKNIDLWIEDDTSVIIIENKIKSKINGEQHDIYSEKIQSQLSDYYAKAKKYSQETNKKMNCYIFSPDYNFINLEKYETGNYYTLIKYSQIYEFYFKNAGKLLHTRYFSEFMDAIYLHSKTVDNSNFEIMKSRFISTIKKKRELENL